MNIQKHFDLYLEYLNTADQLHALKDEWTELIEKVPNAPIFLTWEWISTWWHYFGQDRELCIRTGRDQQGCLLGIAPLMVVHQRIGLHQLRILDFVGSGSVMPVHLDFLIAGPNPEKLYQLFLDDLLSRTEQWDVLRRSSLDTDSDLSALLLTAAGSPRVAPVLKAPYVPLPDSWDAYAKTPSKKLKRNLKYFRSKLDTDFPGDVELGNVTDIQELQSTMKKLEELNRDRWHSRGLTTNFDNATYSSFHETIARIAMEKDWLRLYTLKVGDNIIAVFYCFLFKERVYAYQMGFDMAWSGYSPGRLLIAHGVQEAIREAARELDWGPGDDEYKFAWTQCYRVENDFVLAKRPLGKLWINYMNMKGRLRIAAKQILPTLLQQKIRQALMKQDLTSAHKS